MATITNSVMLGTCHYTHSEVDYTHSEVDSSAPSGVGVSLTGDN